MVWVEDVEAREEDEDDEAADGRDDGDGANGVQGPLRRGFRGAVAVVLIFALCLAWPKVLSMFEQRRDVQRRALKRKLDELLAYADMMTISGIL